MNRCLRQLVSAVSFTLLAAAAHAGSLPIITKCPPDAVLVGPTCVDTYEASVWKIPTAGLIKKVMKGTAKLSDLTGGGATEYSIGNCLPGFPPTFPPEGNWTEKLYAVSVPGVRPTACVTWFLAEQACRSAGKRLLTNQEWQAAAAGTPTDDCNISNFVTENTRSRENCKSSWGVFDMVGNVNEWVADWVPASTMCLNWGGVFGNDAMCLAGASTTVGPGALLRGGGICSSSSTTCIGAGVFVIDGMNRPSEALPSTGFRCAR